MEDNKTLFFKQFDIVSVVLSFVFSNFGGGGKNVSGNGKEMSRQALSPTPPPHSRKPAVKARITS